MLSCREFIETLKYSSSQNLLREIVRSAGLKRFWRFLGYFAASEWEFWNEVEVCAVEKTEDKMGLRESKC